VKGAVIGFLLDANIRRLTAGSKSLDDVMHAMFAKFSGERGFSGADFRMAVADAVGAAKAREMRAWLARVLETTAELDYADALAWFGLRLTPPAGAPRPYLGVVTQIQNGKTIVTGIRRGSPAADAGVSLLDEMAAINGEPFPEGRFGERLAQFSPGEKVTLTTTRRGMARTIDVVLALDPRHGWQLSLVPGARSPHLDTWLAQ